MIVPGVAPGSSSPGAGAGLVRPPSIRSQRAARRAAPAGSAPSPGGVPGGGRYGGRLVREAVRARQREEREERLLRVDPDHPVRAEGDHGLRGVAAGQDDIARRGEVDDPERAARVRGRDRAIGQQLAPQVVEREEVRRRRPRSPSGRGYARARARRAVRGGRRREAGGACGLRSLPAVCAGSLDFGVRRGRGPGGARARKRRSSLRSRTSRCPARRRRSGRTRRTASRSWRPSSRRTCPPCGRGPRRRRSS